MASLSRNVLVFSLSLLVILPYQLQQLVYGANVLAVLPSVWKSHYLFGRRLLESLAQQQNHSVTIISPYNAEEDGISALPNIREIRIDGLMENWLEMGMSFDAEHMRAQSVMERFTRLVYAGTTNVDLLLSDAQVRKLLTSGERFDLLVVDLFLSDALLGLAYYYGIPTVAISPTGANSWLNNMMGNPQNSALDPSYFLPYTEHMDLWQRTLNTLMSLFERMTYNFFHMLAQQSVYAKHFEALVADTHDLVILPHYRDLTKNLSLALINAHPVLHYPRAYVPNMLEIGGAHLLPSDKSLEIPHRHLREFIETAKHGVIYISLGANVRTDELPREKLDTLLDVVAYLKEMRFLLKWESENFDGDLPQNVMINSWFPQEAILAHPNVKLFISSCGLLSTLESIQRHTPILAIPILPEQEVLAKRLQQQGVALIVSYDTIAYDALLVAIRQLTLNDSYAMETVRLSQLLQIGISSGLERALYHIKLTLQTGGANFLKSHANNYNFWRTELLDVVAIIAIGLSCILAIPFFAICCILRKSYYSQEAAAAAAAQPNQSASSYRVTLKAVGRGHSYGGGSDEQDYEYSSGGEAPLRRTRSAYSLSNRSSTSSTTSTSTTSYELTPPPAAATLQHITPLRVFINQKTSHEGGGLE